jgi:hypothetical protein
MNFFKINFIKMVKKLCFLISIFLLFFMPFAVFAGWQDPLHSNDFVTTWKTDVA